MGGRAAVDALALSFADPSAWWGGRREGGRGVGGAGREFDYADPGFAAGGGAADDGDARVSAAAAAAAAV